MLLNGRSIGVAPVTTTVSRWGNHRLRIEMPGYKPYEVSLQKSYNDAANGNIFIGGVWIIVDALTGAIFELDSASDSHAGSPGLIEGVIFSGTTLTISVALKPEPGARRIGQLERQ